VLVAVVESAGTSQSFLQKWAEILSHTADAHLAIAFAHEGATGELMRFCAAVDCAVAAAGVDARRVAIFPTALARPEETRILISLGDVYLDAGASTLTGWAAAEALGAGVPVIAIGKPGINAPAKMLMSIGLPDLIATDFDAYVAVGCKLAADRDCRAAWRAHITTAIEATPDYLDSLAASDAFGALMESAFDELSSLGRAEFRRQDEPVRCFSVGDPTDPVEAGLAAHARGDVESAAMEASLALRSAPADTRVRHLQGLVLHAQGNPSRAVDYLLAAVQRPEATAAIWYSLALALRDNGQVGEAIQVLETCIRMDHRNVEALLTLLELAEAAGATEIARDVLECLQQVAPEDPRVVAMS
jgi:predicted O-linked N-acetylglucosamine transferase (SPINDLY family)